MMRSRMIAAVLLIGLGFTSCSKDNEASDGSNGTTNTSAGGNGGGSAGSDKSLDLTKITGMGSVSGSTSTTKASLNSQAPDFTFKLDNGTISSLSNLRGNYVAMRFWDSGCWVCIGNDNDATDLLYKNFNGKKTTSGGKLIIMGVYPEFGNYFQETKQNMENEIQAQINAGSQILCGGSPQGSCGKGLASSTIQLFDKENRISKSFNITDFNSNWVLIDPTGKLIITPETNQGWPSPIYKYLDKNEAWK